jgi:hypothetical protein
MNWNIEGAHVKGMYMNTFAFAGVVTHSRVMLGGRVQHTVALDSDINVYGAVRDTILIQNSRDEFEITG